jgi:hypothetical protein
MLPPWKLPRWGPRRRKAWWTRRTSAGAPFNNHHGQDNSKEFVQGKQQASRAAAQEQKRQKKSIKESASDREENSDNEYPEYAYQARPEELRLGPRVKIAAEEYDEDEWESASLYERVNGDLGTYRRKTASNYTEPKPKVRLDKTRSTGYNSVESDEEGMPHLIDSDGDIYTGDPVNEAQARERTQHRKRIPQDHWELPEMTIQEPEAIRMQWNGPTNPRIQELAGSQNVN